METPVGKTHPDCCPRNDFRSAVYLSLPLELTASSSSAAKDRWLHHPATEKKTVSQRPFSGKGLLWVLLRKSSLHGEILALALHRSNRLKLPCKHNPDVVRVSVTMLLLAQGKARV